MVTSSCTGFHLQTQKLKWPNKTLSSTLAVKELILYSISSSLPPPTLSVVLFSQQHTSFQLASLHSHDTCQWNCFLVSSLWVRSEENSSLFSSSKTLSSFLICYIVLFNLFQKRIEESSCVALWEYWLRPVSTKLFFVYSVINTSI